MRHLLYSCAFIATLLTCKSDETTKQHQRDTPPAQQIKDCPPGEDTINLITTFTKNTTKTPTDLFYSIIDFIHSKKLFKPNADEAGKPKIEKATGKTFPVAYDTCNMKRWITKNFIMENIQVCTIGFSGTKKDRFTGFTPGLHFEEWKFATNADRDSAMNIVQTAYTYPNSIVIYEKRYSQFILADKRILLLETGAKFVEPYAIEYKKLIEQFLITNYNYR